MKWWGWWRPSNGKAAKANAAEAQLRATRRQTAHVERMAEVLADLPAEELAERMRRAMTVRRA